MEKVVNLLALDPGTYCGWAHSSGPSGTWDLSVRKDESSGMRLVRLRAKLNEIRSSCGVDLLVYEAARGGTPGRLGALVVAGEIQGQIKVRCNDSQVEYRGYSPAEIKRHATAKGNSNKHVMATAAYAKWPDRTFVDDNEVDAVWLLDLAAGELCEAEKY